MSAKPSSDLRKKERNGFSLIEVLIALIIFAIAMTFVEQIASQLLMITTRFMSTERMLELNATVQKTLRTIVENSSEFVVPDNAHATAANELVWLGNYPLALATKSVNATTRGAKKLYSDGKNLVLQSDVQTPLEVVAEGVEQSTFRLDFVTSPSPSKIMTNYVTVILHFNNGRTQEYDFSLPRSIPICNGVESGGNCGEP